MFELSANFLQSLVLFHFSVTNSKTFLTFFSQCSSVDLYSQQEVYQKLGIRGESHCNAMLNNSKTDCYCPSLICGRMETIGMQWIRWNIQCNQMMLIVVLINVLMMSNRISTTTRCVVVLCRVNKMLCWFDFCVVSVILM